MEWFRARPVEFAAVLGLGLFGLLLLARRAARSPGARSMTLLALRATTLAVLMVILLDPVRTTETRIPGEKPSAVYLIDGSRSMSLERPKSRLDNVLAQTARAEQLVAPGRMPSIERYRFGTRLSAISPGEIVLPTDEGSRLRDALERLPERFGDNLPFGVFVFSDGRTNDPAGWEDVAQGYKALGVPIHVLPVGDPATSGDVAIRDMVIPRDASQGSKVPVKLQIGSHGFDGHRVEVVIRPSDGANPRPLATLPLTLTGGDQPAELVIEADRAHTPLVAEVLPLRGEAVIENNRIPFKIGSKSNKIRVIYMEGGPPGAPRRLSEALAEDPDVECLDVGTTGYLGQGALARKDDPRRGYPATRAELFGYDVVICSDIRRDSFTQDQLNWTVEFVADRGGGFVMVGGNNSYGAGQYHKTVWNGLIPVDMGDWGLERGFANIVYWGQDKIFRVVVPPEAQGHPIWHFDDDRERNRAILEKMPVFYGCNLVDRLKPAATVLGKSDRPLMTVGQAPIFSCQSFGRGRTLAMLTDTTPSWGLDFERIWGEGDNRYFRKFWRNVVRWLAENSAGSNRRLDVSTDKIIYRPGQPILVAARAFDESLEHTDRYRLVARLLRSSPVNAGSSKLPPLVAASPLSSQGDRQKFEARLTVPSAEVIRLGDGSTLQSATVEIVALEGDKTVAQANLDVQILDDSDEFHDPRPDPSRLAALARLSGGSVLNGSEDLARLLESSAEPVERVVTTRSPAWDNSLVLSLLCLPLATEWALRRWKGLA
jgi:uncharacterized membrane protein